MTHLDRLSDQPSAAPRSLGAAPCVVFAFTHQSAAALVLLPSHRGGTWPVRPKLRHQLLAGVMGVQTGEPQSGNGRLSAVLGLWK